VKNTIELTANDLDRLIRMVDDDHNLAVFYLTQMKWAAECGVPLERVEAVWERVARGEIDFGQLRAILWNDDGNGTGKG
jgi:hypothetical protein